MNTTTHFLATVCIALATLLTACTDAEQPVQDSTRIPLNVNIHSGLYTRGGVISESYLPNASVVGLFLQKEDGTPYDNLPYNNIPYVATGTGANQTWSPQSADKQILLSSTEGKAYAYYPYNAENTSFSSIHLDASRQDDVMYTSTASTGLNDKNADASFELQHALAVMKVKVKKGSYTGAGVVTSCSISGSPIGLTGTLDGTTGNLSGVTAGRVSADKSYTISGTATDHDIIFVPTTTAGQVTVGLTMDGKEYTTTTTRSETFTSNQCYTLNLTVDDSGATLSGIQVGDWSMSGEGNSIVTAGGYTITFEGDYSGMAFSVSESGGNVTLSACSMDSNKRPQPVSVSGASLSESTSNNMRIITISDITEDVVIIFNGLGSSNPWSYFTVENDGVYGIDDSGNPLTYVEAQSAASLNGVAIVMYGRAMQMSFSDTQGYWGKDGTYMNLGANGIGGGITQGSEGYLPLADGSYTMNINDYQKIKQTYDQWRSSEGTYLADTAGWSHTEALIKAQTNNEYMGPKTTSFRKAGYSQGHRDWFVPAAGQLAYIFLKKSEINTLLSKCTDAKLLSYYSYWSSSESGMSFGNFIDFSRGRMYYADKDNNNYHILWCRYLN